MGLTVQYYDVMLLAIAVSLAVGVGIGVATPISMTVAVPLLGLVAIAIMVHGLFINGPIDEFEDLTEEVEPEEVPGVAMAAQMVE